MKLLGMTAKEKPRNLRRIGPLVLAVAVLGAIVVATRYGTFESDAETDRQAGFSGHSSRSLGARGHPSSGPCGAASAAAIAAVDTSVARRIYAAELHGTEVRVDVAHINGDRALGRALAGSDQAAVHRAVHTLVYTPHWHIVRLRVAQRGRVLADVGGPYIIAPVSGPLKWQGRKVGSYVTAVQDDVGYVKLVSRFTGVPIDIYRGGSFLMGTFQPAPASVREAQSVETHSGGYEAHVFEALAFPTGTLKVALFVHKPSATYAKHSCAALQVAAWGAVAKHVASRFSPLSAHYRDFVGTLQGATDNPVYVRAGSRELAGGGGPTRLPRSGKVKDRGRSWSVYSWEPVPPARIYFLTPAA